MKVTLTTPTHLIGQRADNVFDCPWLARGGAPSGVLGATLTADVSVLSQALKLGFTAAPLTTTVTSAGLPQTIELGLASSSYQFG